MGKFFAATVAAALIVAYIAGWAVSDTRARATPATVQIDPFAMMTSAKQLPSEHFADYSFVF
jgi:predicted Co/Zn/Cd cation transporter (cation efflux family)